MGVCAAVLLGLAPAGCDSASATPQGEDSPQAVYQEVQKILVPGRDTFAVMADLMPILGHEASAQLCGMAVLMAGFSTMGLSEAESEAAGKDLEALLAKHGAQWNQGETINMFGDQEKAKAGLIRAFAGVPDKPKLMTAIGKFCQTHSKDGQVPENESQFVGALQDLQMNGTTATARATVQKSGATQMTDLQFVQENGRWYLGEFMQ